MDYRVSIIIPSYKRGRNLVERAVKSALNQTYENIEIVLVDDNGRDDLVKYREEIETMVSDLKNDKLLYVKNEKNLGGSLARNEGIKAATGEYVTFLDDDDEYEDNKVEHQLRYMVENDLDMCFSDLAIYNEKEKLIDYRTHNEIKSFDSDYLFKYHLTKQIAGTNTFMMKKEVLENIDGFTDAIMGQEFYLMAKIIQSNVKIGYFPESNIKLYRYDIEAISTGPNKIKGQKLLYAYKKKYFDILNRKEKRYIRCRHYAVMAVAYKRNKKFVKAILNLFMAVLADPLLSLSEAFGLRKRKQKNINK